MVSKVLIALCVIVAVVAAVPAASPSWGAWGGGGGNPWIPQWLATAPWMPQWTGPCTTVGPSCLDCNTLTVCTKMGGMKMACDDPTKPHCNLGKCSATPSDQCAVVAVPATV